MFRTFAESFGASALFALAGLVAEAIALTVWSVANGGYGIGGIEVTMYILFIRILKLALAYQLAIGTLAFRVLPRLGALTVAACLPLASMLIVTYVDGQSVIDALGFSGPSFESTPFFKTAVVLALSGVLAALTARWWLRPIEG